MEPQFSPDINLIDDMLARSEGRQQFRMIGHFARLQQAAARDELGAERAVRLIRDLGSLSTSDGDSAQQNHLCFRSLVVFMAAMVLELRGIEQVKLPRKIDLSPLGPTLRGMIKQQSVTGNEHLKTIQIDLTTLQLHLSNSIAGSQTHVLHAGKTFTPTHVLAAGMVHTHPVMPTHPSGHSLHFSPGDIFSFESNPGVVSIVACDDGILMAIKSRDSITPHTALETLERLKKISMQLIDERVDNFAQKFTKRACREFGYTLYMTRNLEELVVSRISLDD